MKPVVLDDMDKILSRKRTLIETVNDQLKNISQIEHSRQRRWFYGQCIAPPILGNPKSLL